MAALVDEKTTERALLSGQRRTDRRPRATDKRELVLRCAKSKAFVLTVQGAKAV
jgi:hypothetical protein